MLAGADCLMLSRMLGSKKLAYGLATVHNLPLIFAHRLILIFHEIIDGATTILLHFLVPIYYYDTYIDIFLCIGHQ